MRKVFIYHYCILQTIHDEQAKASGTVETKEPINNSDDYIYLLEVLALRYSVPRDSFVVTSLSLLNP